MRSDYRPYCLEIRGTLSAGSPVHVGSGLAWHALTDRPVARWNGAANQAAVIPGSSLKGVIRAHLERELPLLGASRADLLHLLGDAAGVPGAGQGRLAVFDARQQAGGGSGEVRDHVRIDRETGAAANKARFDEEVVGSSSKFDFRCIYQGGSAEDPEIRLLREAVRALREGEITVGAGSGIGYGRIRLGKDDLEVWEFARHDAAGLKAYLRHRLTPGKPARELPAGPPAAGTPELVDGAAPRCRLRFDLDLRFDGCFLSRASTPPDGETHADAIYFTSAGKAFLRGSSLRGLLRARAEKICRSTGVKNEVVDRLFGFAKGKDDGRKSRIEFEEAPLIEGTEPREVEADHVGIDRITGFAAEGLKFGAIALESPQFRARVSVALDPGDWDLLALWGFLLRDLVEGFRLRAGGP